ncbi:MAG TPA: hypothetical protein VHC90_24575 [Bryobacteraceae bacterium]|nr:hypothetical protein [Bryobacteraceae bacterium]
MFQKIPILALLFASALSAQVDVLTAQYGNSRTSANMQENVLNTANVNSAQFGKLFSRPVDGPIYAWPLIVTQFKMPDGSVHDLSIVATLNDSVYAYDADDPAQATPYWHVQLGTPIYTGELYLGPEIGIVATPVIDRSTNTIYLTAIINTAAASGGYDAGSFLFALDLGTGALKYNSPQRIVLPLSTGEQQTDATAWLQRAGLLLSDGAVYVGYTYVSDDQLSIEHGFVQAFQADDVSVRLVSWESTPTTAHGGVWQAARGLAADRFGNLFIVTGDGEWNGTTDFGNSVVELHPRTLTVENYFTPSNWEALFQGDIDLGANGVTLMPDTNLAVTGGKQGVVYLLDRSNLGGLQNDSTSDDSATNETDHNSWNHSAYWKSGRGLVPLQSFQASHGCGFTNCGQHLSTAFWANRYHPYLFVWDKEDILRAFPFDQIFRRFRTNDSTVSPIQVNDTGGIVVTSDGNKPRTGVLWAYTASQSPFTAAVPGTLRAFDPTDITKEIYDSDQNATRDATGSFVKFLSPVVANGRVYVGNQSGTMEVYGLLCQTDQSRNLQVRVDHDDTITVTNHSGDAIAGPFTIVLAGLSAGVTVNGSGGVTSCAAPTGNPWIAAAGAPLWLKDGDSFSVQVTLNQTGSQKPHYYPVVLAGSGGQ